MHHELFFALLGHAGDVIEQRSDGFFVRNDISSLTPPERAMIDRLLRLGHAYSHLDRFVSSASKLPSLFVRGLAQGIETILREYMAAVVHLEAKILATRVVFPVPQMMYELEEYSELLPHLHKLVQLVQRGSEHSTTGAIKGAALLKLLHETARSGFPRLRERMCELQRTVHIIWYKQIVSWVVYGTIVDPCNEFFVRKSAVGDKDEGTSQSTEAEIWQTKFSLEMANVPLYVPVRAAESIFFVGKSVQILALSKGFKVEDAQRVAQSFTKIQSEPEFNAATFERVVEDVRSWIAERLYQEIVVKADFIEQLKLLKNMFLLGRGALFQSLLEQASHNLMALKPTLKSEEELHSSVWSQILREYQMEDNPLIKHFRLELPLQTFRFPPFPNANAFALSNVAVVNEQSLQLGDQSQSRGCAWWPHRQVEHLPFTSSIKMELLPSWQGGTVALLLARDDAQGIDGLLTSDALALDGANAPGLIAFEIDLQPIAGDSSQIAVKATVSLRSNGQPTDTQSSTTHAAIPVDRGAVTIHIQYARVEDRDASGRVTYTRQALVIVNGVRILDVACDLSALLGTGSLSHDHYVGLSITPAMRVVEWRLDKYSSRAYITPGQSLSTTHESLSPRELWNYLAMRCELQWPMHLLVSKSLLRSYSQLFQFSFRLKRVAHALESTWKHRILRGGKGQDHSVAVRVAIALRARMSFVVRTIEQYFQVFVVESSFQKCLAEIEAAHDFDRVQRLHDQFVAHLVGRFYLQTHTMQSALEQLLRCCWDFAEYISYQETATNGQGQLLAERVVDLERQFEDKFGLVFRTLRSPNMRDLLVLLDYNEFFSGAVGAVEGDAGSRISMEFNSSH